MKTSPPIARAPEMPPVGDPAPPNCHLIEVAVAELRQLFNAMDPSPFRTRDLDPDAEQFIVGWAREAPRTAPLALLVHLERDAGSPDEPRLLQQAINEYFRERARATRQRLSMLFRVGRISLVIGVVFLVALTAAGHFVSRAVGPPGVSAVVREGASIGGWPSGRHARRLLGSVGARRAATGDAVACWFLSAASAAAVLGYTLFGVGLARWKA